MDLEKRIADIEAHSDSLTPLGTDTRISINIVKDIIVRLRAAESDRDYQRDLAIACAEQCIKSGNEYLALQSVNNQLRTRIEAAEKQKPRAFVHIEAQGDDDYYREIQKTEPHCIPIEHLSWSDDYTESFGQETIDFTLSEGGSFRVEPLYAHPIPSQQAVPDEYYEKVKTWLPRLLMDYEKQSKLNGFTMDTSAGMLRNPPYISYYRCPSHEVDQLQTLSAHGMAEGE